MYGNKIDNLIKMREQGLPVPEFHVLRFGDLVDEGAWQSEFTKAQGKITDPDKLHACLKPGWEKTVRAIADDAAGPFAVRSSCNLEDGEKYSFAGQFATYLNVPREVLSQKVLQCLESLLQESVLKYMEQSGGDASDLQMNVLVQDMVQADRAGVLFTANPQGILNERVIAVGRGLGEGVVSGGANVTTYYYHKTDRLYYYEGAEDLLSAKEVEELIQIAERLEELFGDYLDVEFAIQDGKLSILQVRKITTIQADRPVILDNSNIVESYPGLSLPLTISFVEMVYGGVFKGVSRRVLKNEKELRKHEDVFYHMVGHANGRVYYKISNWYTVLKFLPMHEKIIPVWQEMMGVRQKGYDEEDVKLSPMVRFMTYVNSLYELLSVPRHLKQLEKKFCRVNQEFYANYREDLTPKELIGLYQRVKEQLLDAWDVTLLNDLNTFISTGLVKKRLLKRHPGDEAYANRYISGISNIESMKPVRALIDLAHEYPKLTQKEREEQKKAYVQEYGDRNLEELKLESKTFRSHPEILEEKIREYAADPERLERLWQDLRQERVKTVKEDWLTRFLGKKCAAGIAGRERSRLNRSRVYGMVRLIFRSMGAYYAAHGILQDPEDIFYLTIEEAFALADESEKYAAAAEESDGSKKQEGASGVKVRKMIEERRAAYELFSQLPAYGRLIYEKQEFDKRHERVNAYQRRREAGVLQGVPCSAGEVTAMALVIQSVEDAKDVSDKILVTRMTDPGWVFLLTTAKGVISEKGSLLSHTAIISRELGVPSVVGVENLLETVKTGDLLHVDGNTGRIEIIGGR
ncbi:MAG: phosphoenolpyruvate synthase [Lachnospiraceae bacterium]|nr:phosphoenolpyruvate synthase [Lachnospiraceae bacterium]